MMAPKKELGPDSIEVEMQPMAVLIPEPAPLPASQPLLGSRYSAANMVCEEIEIRRRSVVMVTRGLNFMDF
jgi:hypothetical protein